MIDEQRLVTTFMELVRIDSPSGHERAVADRVTEWLSSLGAAVERDAAGNVYGRLEGQGEPLLLNAHMDTVVPGEGIVPVLKEGIIHSDGRTVLGGDDKAGISVILEAMRAAHAQGVPLPPLDIVFTVQEEVGLRGAKAFDVSRLRAREGIGLDAGGAVGTVVIFAPSHETLDVVVHGVAAHAGAEPERGVSAIEVAADAISHMRLGRIDDETTANIGIIAGGQATNIVCERVELRGEARSRDAAKLAAQVEAMATAFTEAAARRGVTADVQVSHEYTTYHLSPEEPIIQLLAAGAAVEGIEPTYVSTGGGSDANIFNAAGVRIVNISSGMNEVHTTHEHVAVADMARTAGWLLTCLRLRAEGRN